MTSVRAKALAKYPDPHDWTPDAYRRAVGKRKVRP